jgi:hypothetical protein
MHKCDTSPVPVAGRTMAPRQLRLWVQFPLGAWMSIFCECYMFPRLHVLIDLINIQIMQTTLTLLFIRKLFRAQTARHQNKYGGCAPFLNFY